MIITTAKTPTLPMRSDVLSCLSSTRLLIIGSQKSKKVQYFKKRKTKILFFLWDLPLVPSLSLYLSESKTRPFEFNNYRENSLGSFWQLKSSEIQILTRKIIFETWSAKNIVIKNVWQFWKTSNRTQKFLSSVDQIIKSSQTSERSSNNLPYSKISIYLT